MGAGSQKVVPKVKLKSRFKVHWKFFPQSTSSSQVVIHVASSASKGLKQLWFGLQSEPSVQGCARVPSPTLKQENLASSTGSGTKVQCVPSGHPSWQYGLHVEFDGVEVKHVESS